MHGPFGHNYHVFIGGMALDSNNKGNDERNKFIIRNATVV